MISLISSVCVWSLHLTIRNRTVIVYERERVFSHNTKAAIERWNTLMSLFSPLTSDGTVSSFCLSLSLSYCFLHTPSPPPHPTHTHLRSSMRNIHNNFFCIIVAISQCFLVLSSSLYLAAFPKQNSSFVILQITKNGSYFVYLFTLRSLWEKELSFFEPTDLSAWISTSLTLST